MSDTDTEMSASMWEHEDYVNNYADRRIPHLDPDRWQPGDPLFEPSGFNSQPMLGIKWDIPHLLSDSASRWTPQRGWEEP